ncbi:hypothetical protein [Raineyella sp.]|uniref:Uncharacterized protein n=1 Tax=bioreactor metagenome TaxID=1076179 RepID=A0A645AKX2_9ZZZZ|nr:hypothetical protein [Raineyella sp.]MEA5154233.1 hypothetical protein [Raineyella sp.]
MLQLFLAATAQVLVVSIIVGAGLPGVFALGVRWMAAGAGGDAETSHAAARPACTALAVLCFALVLAVIAAGLAILISSGLGYTVSFDHVLPTFMKKG